MDALAIVSIVTSIATLLTVFSKTIKKSSCLGCLNCESRTPEPSIQYIPPQPSPIQSPQIIRRGEVSSV